MKTTRDRVLHVWRSSGMSQRAFADQCGISHGYLHELHVHRDREPDPRVVRAIAKATRISLRWLMLGDA
jgi:transcriptional regulator with XRE-family HTH domain